MKNSNQTVIEVINILNSSIEYLQVHLAKIKSEKEPKYNMICFYPKFFINVSSLDGGKFALGNKVFPEQFTSDIAVFICANIRNGNDEKPVYINHVTYFEKYLAYLQEQVENTKQLLVSI